jgi:hypothetical protein
MIRASKRLLNLGPSHAIYSSVSLNRRNKWRGGQGRHVYTTSSRLFLSIAVYIHRVGGDRPLKLDDTGVFRTNARQPNECWTTC